LVDPFLPPRVYVGGNPIYISNDAGSSWPLTATLPVPAQYAACSLIDPILKADPATPGVLLAGAGHFCGDFGHPPGSLYRSTDYGEHWTRLDLGQEIEGVVDLAYDPVRPHLVYAAARTAA
jgi:hypothetical protein